MTFDIQHQLSAHRFEAIVEDHVCELDYLLQDRTMTITHTGVPPAVSGRGIAAELVRAAYELAKREGWKVMPACSYARVWSERHPEYADLRA